MNHQDIFKRSIYYCVEVLELDRWVRKAFLYENGEQIENSFASGAEAKQHLPENDDCQVVRVLIEQSIIGRYVR